MTNIELNRHKKSDAVKWVAIFLIVILLAVAVFALCAKVFNVACLFSHKYGDDGVCVRCGAEKTVEDEPIVGDNGGMEIGDKNVVEQGIELLIADIPLELYGDYDISPLAETAKQITATITPDYATNQKVDWSVAWKNAQSAWVNNKPVTDFVTAVATSDGALTVNVSCLQAFGEQIILTCTSRDDISKQATCTIDYVEKITSLVFNMPDISAKSSTFTYSVEKSVGTLTADISLSVGDIELTSAFTSVLNSKLDKYLGSAMQDTFSSFVFAAAKLTMGANSTITIARKSALSYRSYFYKCPIDNFMFYFLTFDVDYDEFNYYADDLGDSSILKALQESIISVSGAHATFKLTYQTKYSGVVYSSGTKTVECRFDGNAVRIPVGNISLSDSKVLF